MDRFRQFLRTNPLAKTLVASALALVAGVTVVIVIGPGEDGKTHVTVTVQHRAAPAPLGDLNEGSLHGSPAPPTVQKNRPNEQNLVRPRPAAGAQGYRCTQAFGGHLWSSRNGVRPTEFVVHYTAGNGTARDIDAYFRRTRAASATDILEPGGRCLQEVPLSEKPWTQLVANSYAISVEIVTTGYNVSRAQWLAMPIFRKSILASMMRDQMRQYGIPLRHVDPVGCNFIPGWTDHNALECGNNHTDVQPNFPYDVLQRQLTDSAVISATARKQCTELNTIRRRSRAYHRRYGLKPVPRLSAGKRYRAKALARNLRRHGYSCTVGKPGKRGSITRR